MVWFPSHSSRSVQLDCSWQGLGTLVGRTPLFGLCAAWSTLIEVVLCPQIIFLSILQQVQSQRSSSKYHWAKFWVTDFGVSFPLSLIMIAHFFNALQWTFSNAALNGTSCNHILSFCLQFVLRKSFSSDEARSRHITQALTLTVIIWLSTFFYKWRAIKSS